MLLGTVDSGLFVGLITVVLGGGLITAWSTLRKTPIEMESTSIASLRGVVETQADVIDRQEKVIARQETTIAEQERTIEDCKRKLNEALMRIDALEATA